MRKATVLINVIIIMVMLNILVLSVFIMNKNVVNSRYMAITDKANDIYSNSKEQIVDFLIYDIFKEALYDLKKHYDKGNTEQIGDNLSTFTGIKIRNLSRDIDYELKKELQGLTTSKIELNNNIIEFILSYKKEDNTEIYYNYVLKLPDFSKEEDVEKLKSGQIDAIYNEYKQSIIDEKIIN